LSLVTDKTGTGLAGEYHVLAQLAERGLVGALTLSNTKGVDILVSSTTLRHLFRLEVKTSRKDAARETLFGEKPFFRWPMSAKHEKLSDARLYYCFVALSTPIERPRFFIVASAYVARYVRDEHRRWRATRRHEVASTPLRKFRIPVDDPQGFEDNWGVFDGRGRS
jgi:hypothetical protein